MLYFYFHIIEAVLALAFLGFGFLVLKKPPEYKSALGFSTALSRRDVKHWELAQTYAALIMMAYGVLLAILFVIINFALKLGASFQAMLAYYAAGAVCIIIFVPLVHVCVRARLGER